MTRILKVVVPRFLTQPRTMQTAETKLPLLSSTRVTPCKFSTFWLAVRLLLSMEAAAAVIFSRDLRCRELVQVQEQVKPTLAAKILPTTHSMSIWHLRLSLNTYATSNWSTSNWTCHVASLDRKKSCRKMAKINKRWKRVITRTRTQKPTPTPRKRDLWSRRKLWSKSSRFLTRIASETSSAKSQNWSRTLMGSTGMEKNLTTRSLWVEPVRMVLLAEKGQELGVSTLRIFSSSSSCEEKTTIMVWVVTRLLRHRHKMCTK